MTGYSDHEDWLDELDKKLVINNEGIISFFGPDPYFVSFEELNSDSSILSSVLKFTLLQIDYLPNSDYLAQRFIRHAYLQNNRFKQIKDPYQVYRWHSLENLNAKTNGEVKYSDIECALSIGSDVICPSLKIKWNKIERLYVIERLVGGKKGSTRRTKVARFSIYTSENHVVILLPESSEWFLYVGEELQANEPDLFYRISINCKHFCIDKNNLLIGLSEINKNQESS